MVTGGVVCGKVGTPGRLVAAGGCVATGVVTVAGPHDTNSIELAMSMLTRINKFRFILLSL
jgi:hypothetical protein